MTVRFVREAKRQVAGSRMDEPAWREAYERMRAMPEVTSDKVVEIGAGLR